METKPIAVLPLALLLIIFPLSPAYGLGPERIDTALQGGGIFGTNQKVGDSAAGSLLSWVMNFVPVAGPIKVAGAVAMEYFPMFKEMKNSVIEAVSTNVTTPATNVVLGSVPGASNVVWNMQHGNGKILDAGIFGGNNAPSPQTQESPQSVSPSDNSAPAPVAVYTFGSDWDVGPVKLQSSQKLGSSYAPSEITPSATPSEPPVLKISTGIEEAPRPQTFWGGWGSPANDSNYPGTDASLVTSQVEQPAVTTWSGFPWFSDSNSSNQLVFSQSPADNSGPYDWASQFYNQPIDSGRAQQSNGWPYYTGDTGGSSDNWYSF